MSAPDSLPSEEHYKQRLRDALPFLAHTRECDFAKWQLHEFLQKAYGPGYSAGPQKPCTCGLSALEAIIRAEVLP